jgi:hypothetical protein
VPLLHVVFEKSNSKKMREDIAKLIKFKIEEVGAVVGHFMPIHFFTMSEFVTHKIQNEDELIH